MDDDIDVKDERVNEMKEELGALLTVCSVQCLQEATTRK